MRISFVMVLGMVLLALASLSAPAAAQPACEGFCNPLMPCNMPCHIGYMPLITCGEYQNCNSNVDGDNIDWWVDNCPDVYNPDQADCDGDDIGDACDSKNEKWVYVSTDPNLCYIDVDDHLLFQTLEAYGKQTFQNICGAGGTCIKHYFLGGGDCPRPLSSAYCCKQEMPDEVCDMFLNHDLCGTPKCAF